MTNMIKLKRFKPGERVFIRISQSGKWRSGFFVAHKKRGSLIETWIKDNQGGQHRFMSIHEILTVAEAVEYKLKGLLELE